MAEEMLWNKKLLVISLILGVAAVALFYLYDTLQRQRVEGDTIQFLRWKRDMNPSDEVARTDVEVFDVSRRTQAAYEGVLQNSDTDWALVVNNRVNHSVRRTQPVRYADIMGTGAPPPADRISMGMRAYPIQVDPLSTGGGMLRVNDRVDLVGLVSLKGKTRAYILIENLRVLGVGGRGEAADLPGDEPSRRDPGQMVYRSITVEVAPEIALKLTELLPRVQGKLSVVQRRPDDTTVKFKGVNPALEDVLNEPLPAMMGPPGPGM